MTPIPDFHRTSRELIPQPTLAITTLSPSAANDVDIDAPNATNAEILIPKIADIKAFIQLIHERVDSVIGLIGPQAYEGFTRAVELYDETVENRYDDEAIKDIHELIVIQVRTVLTLILAAEHRKKAEYSSELFKRKNARLNEVNLALHRKTQVDPLTNIYNQAGLKKEGRIIFELCKKKDAPLSCLFIDIDYFKPINDAHGHQAGDMVLARFAEIITEEFRGSDVIFGRDGGEEFIVLMPYTALEDAAIGAERFRKRIQNEQINIIKKNGRTKTIHLELTCTVGVSQADFEKDTEVNEVKGYADTAVQIGKTQHRNVVSVVKLDPETRELSIKYPFLEDPTRKVIAQIPRYSDPANNNNEDEYQDQDLDPDTDTFSIEEDDPDEDKAPVHDKDTASSQVAKK